MALLRSVARAAFQGRRTLAALAVILVCCLVLFGNAILRGWIYYEFDTTIYYYPVTAWLDRALSQGRLPLWSPYIYGGFPLFADGETGVLYPLNWILLLLLSPMQAFIWLTVLRYFLAGAFAYALLRVFRLGQIPAVVGALTVMLGSFMITQMHHVNVVNSAVWLPLILLFAELALRAVGWRTLLFAAIGSLAVGMQMLTIHIQPVLMSAMMVALYLAFRVLFGRERDLARRAKRAGAVAVGILLAGLGLGAVQLVPLWELATQTSRGNGASYDFASAFGPAPLNLITLLFPYFFRISGYDYWTLWFRWETTTYVGIVPLLLAIAAVTLQRSREAFFFGGVGLFSLLLALGDYLPLKLYWLVWNIPGFSFARAPGRFSMLFVFSAAVLAALGMQYLQSRLNSASARTGVKRLLVAGALGGVVLFLSVIVARSWLAANKAAATSLIASEYLSQRKQAGLPLAPDRIYEALLNTLRWQNGRTVLTFVLLLAALVAIAVWFRRPRFGFLCQSALVALVAVDLLAFAMIFHPEMSVAQLSGPSRTAQFLSQRTGLHRTYTIQPFGPTTPNRLLPYRVAAVSGYSSLDWSRYRDYRQQVLLGNNTLLDLWNVRYVVAPRNAPSPGSREKYRSVYEDDEVVVYENATYLSRAFLVNRVRVVDSAKAAMQAMTAQQFDPRREVIVEATGVEREGLIALAARLQSSPVATSQPSPEASPEIGRATVADYASTAVTVNTDAKEDALLIFSDSYYPGWEATVDGQPAPIYRADYLFRAVYVPKGSHSVLFRYEPFTFRLGAAISLGTALLLPFGIYLAFVFERRRALRFVRRRESALELGGMA